jgi:hypothetical protein
MSDRPQETSEVTALMQSPTAAILNNDLVVTGVWTCIPWIIPAFTTVEISPQGQFGPRIGRGAGGTSESQYISFHAVDKRKALITLTLSLEAQIVHAAKARYYTMVS